MDAYEKARVRVKKKKEFYQHLASYVIMSGFFFLLNAVTSFGSWWFYWPMMGWGIGLAFHYFDAFGFPGVGEISEEWEQRAIEEELQKMGADRGPSAMDEKLDLKELEKRPNKWNDSDLV